MSEPLAKLFHETYERLAPSFNYQTREDSAVPWVNVPSNNRKLMIAVCAEIERHVIRKAVEIAFLSYATSDPSAPPVADRDLGSEADNINNIVQQAINEGAP